MNNPLQLFSYTPKLNQPQKDLFMKKIMTVLTAVSLCAGVMVASYAASQNQAAMQNQASAAKTAANPCEQRKEAALQHCNNDRCKQHIARSYSKCNVAFAKAHPQMNAQQPQTQQQ
jgi:hypothetical protein